jgi:hypothetical protein
MHEYEFIKTVEHDPRLVAAPAAVFLATLAVCWVARHLLLRGLEAWTARSQSRGGEGPERADHHLDAGAGHASGH